jgi:uncharacterized protein YbjT (DUF2867 family)
VGLRERSGEFDFVGTHKLVALHGNGDFERTLAVGAAAAKNFAKAADADGRIAAGKRDDVLDPAARFDTGTRAETYAAGADVTGLLRDAHTLVSQLQDLQRELQLVSLSATLFQILTVRSGDCIGKRGQYHYFIFF